LSSILEESDELEKAYTEAAMLGDSSAPENPDMDVDFHFVAFVKAKNGIIYELDGDRRYPIHRGEVFRSDEDALGEGGLKIIRERINQEKSKGDGFSLMALVKRVS
jgi:ubiquitin carboxyl-terminal hydrolase L3